MAFGQLVTLNNVAGTVLLLVGQRCVLRRANIINTTAAESYVQMFDAAAVGDVTIGTTSPRLVLPVAAATAAFHDLGDVVFDNGVAVASTTTPTGLTGAATHVRIVVV